MPRFYVDVQNDQIVDRDSSGVVMPDKEAAREYAINALTLTARTALPDGSSRTFVAILKTDKGRTIFRASLSFSSVWIE